MSRMAAARRFAPVPRCGEVEFFAKKALSAAIPTQRKNMHSAYGERRLPNLGELIFLINNLRAASKCEFATSH